MLNENVVVIDAPADLQLKRIMKRDGCTEKIARNIISIQITGNERSCYANDLIINDGSIEDFQKKLDFYYELYTNLADEQKN